MTKEKLPGFTPRPSSCLTDAGYVYIKGVLNSVKRERGHLPSLWRICWTELLGMLN